MRSIRTFIFIATSGFFISQAEANPLLTGLWVPPGHDAILSLSIVDSRGTIILTRLLNPERDRMNPDTTLQNRLLEGLPVGRDFQTNGDDWRGGHLYDPDSGKTYRANLTLLDSNHLEIRGYIGTPLLGRSQTWTRFELFKAKMNRLLGNVAEEHQQ